MLALMSFKSGTERSN